METLVERHQLAGVDDRERGFNRTVELHGEDNAYRALFRYEQLYLRSDPAETTSAALSRLVRDLHAMGYTQMRSRVSFRGHEYLGTQEPWTEHPDPGIRLVLDKLVRLFHRVFASSRE